MAVLAVLGVAVYSGGQKLCREMALLLSAAPGWIEKLDVWLTAVCHSMEEILCLKSNVLVFLMRRMLRGLLTVVTDGAVPYLWTFPADVKAGNWMQCMFAASFGIYRALSSGDGCMEGQNGEIHVL